MPLVVLLKGVNVGGYRTFRPSQLAKQLQRFDVVNIGAAGTFVVRKPVSRTILRGEIARRLPFDADVMICNASEILRLASDDPFAAESSGRLVVPFVSVLSKRPRSVGAMPMNFPSDGEWGVKVLGCQDRLVYGLYRREMKAIGYLGQLEKVFGASVTTRSWSTILSIARVLKS
jgi:uncharacterized protein (DUF1697 family)